MTGLVLGESGGGEALPLSQVLKHSSEELATPGPDRSDDRTFCSATRGKDSYCNLLASFAYLWPLNCIAAAAQKQKSKD